MHMHCIVYYCWLRPLKTGFSSASVAGAAAHTLEKAVLAVVRSLYTDPMQLIHAQFMRLMQQQAVAAFILLAPTSGRMVTGRSGCCFCGCPRPVAGWAACRPACLRHVGGRRMGACLCSPLIRDTSSTQIQGSVGL